MEKIYGIYTGNVDMSGLDDLHEIDVWKKIETIGGSLFWANHDAGDGRIELSQRDKEKMEDMQYVLEYLVYYTRKFGVTFNSEPKIGEHIQRSDDYNEWYRFWNDYVQSWTDEQMNDFIKRRQRGQDFSDLLPKTNWKGELVVDSVVESGSND